MAGKGKSFAMDLAGKNPRSNTGDLFKKATPPLWPEGAATGSAGEHSATAAGSAGEHSATQAQDKPRPSAAAFSAFGGKVMDGVAEARAKPLFEGFRMKTDASSSSGGGMKITVDWLAHQYEDLVQGGEPRKGPAKDLHTDYTMCNLNYRNETHFMRLGHHLERCINYINGRPHVVGVVETDYLVNLV